MQFARHRPGGPRGAVAVAFLLVAAWLGAPAAGQGSGTAPAAAPEKPRVAILGASVSAGFANFITATREQRNQTYKLRRVLQVAWPRDAVSLSDFSQVELFRRPTELGPNQVRKALAKQPDLVIAADFTFWFGYGGGFGGLSKEQRLARQRVALTELAKFDCPILIGDYPDMTGADRRICPPSLIPDLETQAELNRRLREWAAERDHVTLFPLADWVKTVKADAFAVELDGEKVALPRTCLLQNDNLHASRLGATVFGARVLEFAKRMLPEGHALTAKLPTLDDLVAALRVEDEIPEPAAAGKGAGDGDRQAGRSDRSRDRRLPARQAS